MSNPYVAPFLKRLEHRYSRDYLDMSYTDWICSNTTLAGKPFNLSRYKFQREIIDDMHPDMDVKKCSQVGLALALDTPILTLDGWKTMGSLLVGDTLFDEQGQPCQIEYVSPTYVDHECFRLTFDDGQTIVADAGHKWFVQSERPFDLSGGPAGKGRPPSSVKMFKDGVLTTKQIAQFHRKANRNRFAVPNTKPLTFPERPLRVDPYLLGLHLGDGNSHACCLTSHSKDFAFYQEELTKRGMKCVSSSTKDDIVQFLVHFPHQKRAGRGVPYSVHSRFTDLGLLEGDKFVPPQYLKASQAQRLDLLRGLLDTDGSITKNGRVSFYNTSERLVRSVEELACSLGFKTRTRWRMNTPSVMQSGHVITPRKPLAEVSFVAYQEDGIFLLPRKRERLRSRNEGRPSEALRRRIIAVDEVPSVPVRCISVNSPSHLFLAGRGMIPTHNTEVQIRKALAFLVRNRGTKGIFTLPNEPLMDKVSQTRIQPITERDKVFNTEQDKKAVRSKTIMQFGDSFLYVTGCTEADATSTSADFVMNDEVDISPQDILALFNSRLQDSDWKINQRFSTPTFPSFGIDLGFSSSDQKVYMAKCEACNHYNVPEFSRQFCHIPGLPDYIENLDEIEDSLANELDLENAYVCCEKCGYRLNLGDESLRQWVPKYPGRKRLRGYHVTPFCTDRLPLSYLIQQLGKYKKREYKRGFYNTVLGEGYSDGNIRLDESAIRACMTEFSRMPDVGSDVPLSVGIDMGQTCHLTLAAGGENNLDVVLFEAIPVDLIVDRSKEICAKYNVVRGAVDRHPYEPTADEIMRVSDGKIIPTEYRGTAELNVVKNKFGQVTHAQVNRTMHLDAIASDIRNRRCSFSGYGHYKTTVVEHLRDMVRDEQPEKPAEWKKLTGNDHFFHSLAFTKSSFKIKELVAQVTQEEIRTMTMYTTVKVETNTDGLTGKYFDRSNLRHHNEYDIIRVH